MGTAALPTPITTVRPFGRCGKVARHRLHGVGGLDRGIEEAAQDRPVVSHVNASSLAQAFCAKPGRCTSEPMAGSAGDRTLQWARPATSDGDGAQHEAGDAALVAGADDDLVVAVFLRILNDGRGGLAAPAAPVRRPGRRPSCGRRRRRRRGSSSPGRLPCCRSAGRGCRHAPRSPRRSTGLAPSFAAISAASSTACAEWSVPSVAQRILLVIVFPPYHRAFSLTRMIRRDTAAKP